MPHLAALAWPGCAWTELSPAIGMMAPRWPLRVLGPSASPVRTLEGVTLLPDAAWACTAPGDIGALLVPGGDPEPALDDPALGDLLRTVAARATVAAICNGALVLASAGLLRGRRCTHTAVEAWAPRPEFDALLAAAGPLFEGSIYVDEDLVLDGSLLTAKPWAAVRWGAAVARRAGALDRAAAAAAARYAAGRRDRPGVDPHQAWGIHLEPTDRPTTREHVRAHVGWLHALERQGTLLLAGPWADGEGGLVVVRAPDEPAARALATEDPFVQAGVRRARVRLWLLSCEDNDHLGALS